MTMHTDKTFTQFKALMADFIKSRPGSTAKESEKNLAVFLAERTMLTHALAYLGTEDRAKRLRPLFDLGLGEGREWVPMLDSYKVGAWLKTVRERWDDNEWSSRPDEEFFEQVGSEFDKLVYGDEDGFRDYYQSMRKSGVLAGVLEPKPEDKEWLEEEHDRFASLSDPYKAALDKLKG